MANIFLVPGCIVSGENALKDSMEYMKAFGQRTLIVTDEMMMKLGNVSKLTGELHEAGIKYEIYAGVNSEPDDRMVTEGADIYMERKCDFLIGLGGGSPMDTAKAIGIVVSNGGNICDYAHRKIERKLPPVAAIPTTAGTGSEATRVTVIKDTERGVKMMLSDAKLLASLAVVDPVFTMTAPRSVTVNTGVDALSHAIESFTSVKAFPLSRLYSLDAIKKIYKNLPLLYEDGSNAEARRQMAEASMEAGIAFSNASVTIVHGMSRPIGALFHVPHGLSNAMLLEICLPYIKEGAAQEFCQLAKQLGIYTGDDIEEGAEVFTEAVISLLNDLDIPKLSSLGIDKNEYFGSISKMASDALDSGSPQNCKNVPEKAEIEHLYEKLWG